MNIEQMSPKYRNDLEQQTQQLLTTIRRAKLENAPLVEALNELQQELEQYRRKQFDSVNTEYHTY